MSAQERQMLRSKDVLVRIVLSAVCNPEKFGPQLLHSVVHVAMETMKTSHLTCQSKSFISIYFTCHVSAYKLQPFSCHDLAMRYTHKLSKLCSATLTERIT